MKNKTDRIKFIRQVCLENNVSSQEELLSILKDNGFNLTQATLSRDLKRLKISKTLTPQGLYRYVVPLSTFPVSHTPEVRKMGVGSLEFSGHLAVIKTKSGYAGGIASEIDSSANSAILGTVAGDDTIIIVPREGFSREEITKALTKILEESEH
ncbi:MAG: hypothetical protein MJ010_00125 [Paludibacteraceae bacterium]|nr:hypothetical protein [Paludibacteraceae bacterium]